MANLPPKHIHYTVYEPHETAIKAAILLLHGMQEHSGRYAGLANYLKDLGYAVITYDHTGHGRTAKNDAQMGFFQKEHPEKLLISEAKQMAYFMRNRFPHVSLILIGHSMGSFIARLLLGESSTIFSGAILIGTGDLNIMANLFLPILRIANMLSPTKRSKWLNKLFSSINNQRFNHEKPNDGTNWLSISKANRKTFLDDPLCGVDFSNNAFFGLISLQVKATKPNWAKEIDKAFPILFLSGTEDPIGNFGKGVEQTVRKLRLNGFQHIALKFYPNMRHEILNEDNRTIVFQDIAQWLEELLTPNSTTRF